MTSASPDDAASLARALLRLARTGAYAEPCTGAGSCHYQVLSPRNAFAAPVAEIAEPMIAQARDLGWLSPAGAEGRLQLSKSGRRALKRAFATTDARPLPQGPHVPRAAARVSASNASPSRGPQRLEGPLLWLRNRKDRGGRPLITQAQYEAGTRFAADYIKGQMHPRVTASWSLAAPCLRTGTPGGGVDISDAALAARDRLHEAMGMVPAEMARFLVDVCCHDIGLETAERARGWPVRSGKVVLDMGLTALARHYGLEATPRFAEPAASPRRPKSRRWADPAFTPTLANWDFSLPAEASRDADATASP